MQKSYLKFAVSGAVALAVASFNVTPVAAGENVVTPFEPGFVIPPIGSGSKGSGNEGAGGNGSGGNEEESTTPELETVPLTEVSNAGTTAVTAAIQAVYSFCSSADQTEYLVDCLGAGLADVADKLPDTGDYAEAQAILEDASAKLRALARANASNTLPRARLAGKVNNKPVRTKRLTPVKTEAVSSTGQQAAAILQEAETLLLRSAANSDRRKVHYAQMAKAVGSETVLLRSL